MKYKVLLLAIVFVLINAILLSDAKFRYRILKFICETSNKTVLNNVSCTYKTYKGGRCLANFRATIIRPAKSRLDMLVSLLLHRKNLDGFQKVLDIQNVEVCKLLKSIQQSPIPFVGEIMDYLKTGGAFEKGNVLDFCDMVDGEINFFNGSLENFEIIEMFPAGSYLMKINFSDNFDDDVMRMSILSHFARAKSSIKV